MYRIGLTGGIAGGKSEVAATLRSLGAHVLIADEISRDQARPGTPVLEELVDEFGRGVLREDGTLDRGGLGRIVFADPARLSRLNEITHPPLVEAILREMEDLERERSEGVLVVDAALILDWDMADAFDLVVAVRAPLEARIERLVRGGLTESEARARIEVQISDDRFAKAADVMIDNDGSLEDLRVKVSELWRRVGETSARESI